MHATQASVLRPLLESQVFVGKQGEALIINAKGEIFRGRLGEGIQYTKEGLKIVWDQLKPYKGPK